MKGKPTVKPVDVERVLTASPDAEAAEQVTGPRKNGLRIGFGKHGPQPDNPEGELFTRLPVSYLRWMINNKTRDWEIAKAEFERRGDTMPKVELSGHAIDNASLRVRRTWHETREQDEGIYSWLQRMTLEAIDKGERMESGKIKYQGIKFVIKEGEEFPILKTVMT